jgi:gliding motility-associated-like protein
MYNGQSITSNQFSYFLTGLQFYQSTAPPPVVHLISGDSCSAAITLQVQPTNYYRGSRFQWYRNDTALGGQTGPTITLAHGNTRPAAYRCRIQNDSICLVSNPFPVSWLASPQSTALGSADTTACTNDTVLLDPTGDPSFTFRWQDGSTLPYMFVTRPGTYTVSIANACGTALAQKTVRFGACDLNVYVPNGFTPNGDGHNDVFHPHFFYLPRRFLLRVFNRSGLEVFTTTDPARGWDGDYNGYPQPAGGYIWEIGYQDRKGQTHNLHGTVVLVR